MLLFALLGAQGFNLIIETMLQLLELSIIVLLKCSLPSAFSSYQDKTIIILYSCFTQSS